MKSYSIFVAESKGEFSYPYIMGIRIAEEFCAKLDLPLIKEVGPYTEGEPNKIYLCGSLRRKEKMVNDIDLLITSNITVSDIEKIDGVVEMTAKGTNHIYFIYNTGKFNISFNLFILTNETIPWKDVEVDSWRDCFGSMMMHLTGPSGYNIGLRVIAKKLGYKINQYGIFKKDSKRPLPGTGKNEFSVYHELKVEKYPEGKPWKAPERRGKSTPKSENIF